MYKGMQAVGEVKYFAGIIIRRETGLWEMVRELLEGEFSRLEFKSSVIPFDFTDYYEPQMGANLVRFWVAFSGLFAIDELADWKLRACKLEERLRDTTGRRKVNIDPGYLELSKVVLASLKNYSHRIYIGKGVFAQVEYIYKDGRFVVLDWTYPDYRTEVALSFFSELRERYKMELRKAGPR